MALTPGNNDHPDTPAYHPDMAQTQAKAMSKFDALENQSAPGTLYAAMHADPLDEPMEGTTPRGGSIWTRRVGGTLEKPEITYQRDVDRSHRERADLSINPYSLPTTWSSSPTWDEQRQKELEHQLYLSQAMGAISSGVPAVEAISKIPVYQQALSSGAIPLHVSTKLAGLMGGITRPGSVPSQLVAHAHQLGSDTQMGEMDTDDNGPDDTTLDRRTRLRQLADAQPEIDKWYQKTAQAAASMSGFSQKRAEQIIRQAVPNLSDEQLRYATAPEQTRTSFSGGGGGKTTSNVAAFIHEVFNNKVRPEDIYVGSTTTSGYEAAYDQIRKIQPLLENWSISEAKQSQFGTWQHLAMSYLHTPVKGVDEEGNDLPRKTPLDLIGMGNYQPIGSGGKPLDMLNSETGVAERSAYDKERKFLEAVMAKQGVRVKDLHGEGVRSVRDIIQNFSQTRGDSSDTHSAFDERYTRGSSAYQSGSRKNLDALFYATHRAMGGDPQFTVPTQLTPHYTIDHAPELAARAMRQTGHQTRFPHIIGEEIQDASRSMGNMLAANQRPHSLGFFTGDMSQRNISVPYSIADHLGPDLARGAAGRRSGVSNHPLTLNFRSGPYQVAKQNALLRQRVARGYPVSPQQISARNPGELAVMDEHFMAATPEKAFEQMLRTHVSNQGLTWGQIRQNLAAGKPAFTGARMPKLQESPLIFKRDKDLQGFSKVLRQVSTKELGQYAPAFQKSVTSATPSPTSGDTKLHAIMLSQAKSRGFAEPFIYGPRVGIWNAGEYATTQDYTAESRAKGKNFLFGVSRRIRGNPHTMTPDLLAGTLPVQHGQAGVIEEAAYQTVHRQSIPYETLPPILQQAYDVRNDPGWREHNRSTSGTGDPAITQQFINDVLTMQQYAQPSGVMAGIQQGSTSDVMTPGAEKGDAATNNGFSIGLNPMVTEQKSGMGDMRPILDTHEMLRQVYTGGPQMMGILPHVDGVTPGMLPTASQIAQANKRALRRGNTQENPDDPNDRTEENASSVWNSPNEAPDEDNHRHLGDMPEKDFGQQQPDDQVMAPQDVLNTQRAIEGMIKGNAPFRMHPAVQAIMREQVVRPSRNNPDVPWIVRDTIKKARDLGLADTERRLQQHHLHAPVMDARKEVIKRLTEQGALQGQPYHELNDQQQKLVDDDKSVKEMQHVFHQLKHADLQEQMGALLAGEGNEELSQFAIEKTAFGVSSLHNRPDVMAQLSEAALQLHLAHPNQTTSPYGHFASMLGAYTSHMQTSDGGIRMTPAELDRLARDNPMEHALIMRHFANTAEGQEMFPLAGIQKGEVRYDEEGNPYSDDRLAPNKYGESFLEQLPFLKGMVVRGIKTEAQGAQYGISQAESRRVTWANELAAFANRLEVGGGVIDPHAVSAFRPEGEQPGLLKDYPVVDNADIHALGTGVPLGSLVKRYQDMLAREQLGPEDPRYIHRDEDEGVDHRPMYIKHYQEQYDFTSGLRQTLNDPEWQRTGGHALNLVGRIAMASGPLDYSLGEEGDAKQRENPIDLFFQHQRKDFGEGTRDLASINRYQRALTTISQAIQTSGTVSRGHINELIESVGHDPNDDLFVGLRNLESKGKFTEPESTLTVNQIADLFPETQEKQNVLAQATRYPFRGPGESAIFLGGMEGFTRLTKGQVDQGLDYHSALGMTGTLHPLQDAQGNALPFGFSRNAAHYFNDKMMTPDEQERYNKGVEKEMAAKGLRGKEAEQYRMARATGTHLSPLYQFRPDHDPQKSYLVRHDQVLGLSAQTGNLKVQQTIEQALAIRKGARERKGDSERTQQHTRLLNHFERIDARSSSGKWGEGAMPARYQLLQWIKANHAQNPKYAMLRKALEGQVGNWVPKEVYTQQQKVAEMKAAHRPLRRSMLTDRMLQAKGDSLRLPGVHPDALGSGKVLVAKGMRAAYGDLEQQPSQITVPAARGYYQRDASGKMVKSATYNDLVATERRQHYTRTKGGGFLPSPSRRVPAPPVEPLVAYPDKDNPKLFMDKPEYHYIPSAPPASSFQQTYGMDQGFVRGLPRQLQHLPPDNIGGMSSPPSRPPSSSTSGGGGSSAIPEMPSYMQDALASLDPSMMEPPPESDENNVVHQVSPVAHVIPPRAVIPQPPPPPPSITAPTIAPVSPHDFLVPEPPQPVDLMHALRQNLTQGGNGLHKPSQEQLRFMQDPTLNKVVEGGPGSGKTATIAQAVGYDIARGEYLPENVRMFSAITSATGVLDQNFAAMQQHMPKNTPAYQFPRAQTFHSLAHQIAFQSETAEETGHVSYPQLESIGVHNFSGRILEDPDPDMMERLRTSDPQQYQVLRDNSQHAYMRSVVEQYHAAHGITRTLSDHDYKDLQNHISTQKKSRGTDDESYTNAMAQGARDANAGTRSQNAYLYQYEQQLQRDHTMDQDDPILHATRVLQQQGPNAIPNSLLTAQTLVTDEAQDITPQSRALLETFTAVQRQLHPGKVRHLVGMDVMQSMLQGMGGYTTKAIRGVWSKMLGIPQKGPKGFHQLTKNFRSDQANVAITRATINHPALLGEPKSPLQTPVSSQVGLFPHFLSTDTQPEQYAAMFHGMLGKSGIDLTNGGNASAQQMRTNILAGAHPFEGLDFAPPNLGEDRSVQPANMIPSQTVGIFPRKSDINAFATTGKGILASALGITPQQAHTAFGQMVHRGQLDPLDVKKEGADRKFRLLTHMQSRSAEWMNTFNDANRVGLWARNDLDTEGKNQGLIGHIRNRNVGDSRTDRGGQNIVASADYLMTNQQMGQFTATGRYDKNAIIGNGKRGQQEDYLGVDVPPEYQAILEGADTLLINQFQGNNAPQAGGSSQTQQQHLSPSQQQVPPLPVLVPPPPASPPPPLSSSSPGGASLPPSMDDPLYVDKMVPGSLRSRAGRPKRTPEEHSEFLRLQEEQVQYQQQQHPPEPSSTPPAHHPVQGHQTPPSSPTKKGQGPLLPPPSSASATANRKSETSHEKLLRRANAANNRQHLSTIKNLVKLGVVTPEQLKSGVIPVDSLAWNMATTQLVAPDHRYVTTARGIIEDVQRQLARKHNGPGWYTPAQERLMQQYPDHIVLHPETVKQIQASIEHDKGAWLRETPEKRDATQRELENREELRAHAEDLAELTVPPPPLAGFTIVSQGDGHDHYTHTRDGFPLLPPRPPAGLPGVSPEERAQYQQAHPSDGQPPPQNIVALDAAQRQLAWTKKHPGRPLPPPLRPGGNRPLQGLSQVKMTSDEAVRIGNLERTPSGKWRDRTTKRFAQAPDIHDAPVERWNSGSDQQIPIAPPPPPGISPIPYTTMDDVQDARAIYWEGRYGISPTHSASATDKEIMATRGEMRAAYHHGPYSDEVLAKTYPPPAPTPGGTSRGTGGGAPQPINIDQAYREHLATLLHLTKQIQVPDDFHGVVGVHPKDWQDARVAAGFAPMAQQYMQSPHAFSTHIQQGFDQYHQQRGVPRLPMTALQQVAYASSPDHSIVLHPDDLAHVHAQENAQRALEASGSPHTGSRSVPHSFVSQSSGTNGSGSGSAPQPINIDQASIHIERLSSPPPAGYTAAFTAAAGGTNGSSGNGSSSGSGTPTPGSTGSMPLPPPPFITGGGAPLGAFGPHPFRANTSFSPPSPPPPFTPTGPGLTTTGDDDKGGSGSKGPNFNNPMSNFGRSAARIGNEMQFLGKAITQPADSALAEGSNYRLASVPLSVGSSGKSDFGGTTGFFDFQNWSPSAITGFQTQMPDYSYTQIATALKQYGAATGVRTTRDQQPLGAVGNILQMSSVSGMDPAQLMQQYAYLSGLNGQGKNQKNPGAFNGMLTNLLGNNLDSTMNMAPTLDAVSSMAPMLQSTQNNVGSGRSQVGQSMAILQLAQNAGMTPQNFGDVTSAMGALTGASTNPDLQQQQALQNMGYTLQGDTALTSYQQSIAGQQQQLKELGLQQNINEGVPGAFGGQSTGQAMSLPKLTMKIEQAQISMEGANVAMSGLQLGAAQLSQQGSVLNQQYGQASYNFTASQNNALYGPVGADQSKLAGYSLQQNQLAAGRSITSPEYGTMFTPQGVTGLRNQEFYAGLQNQQQSLVLGRSPLLSDALFQQQMKYIAEQANYYKEELALQNAQRTFDLVWQQKLLDQQAKVVAYNQKIVDQQAVMLGIQQQQYGLDQQKNVYDQKMAALADAYLGTQIGTLGASITAQQQAVQGLGPTKKGIGGPEILQTMADQMKGGMSTDALKNQINQLTTTDPQDRNTIYQLVMQLKNSPKTLAQMTTSMNTNPTDKSVVDLYNKLKASGALANQSNTANAANNNLLLGGTGLDWQHFIAAIKANADAIGTLNDTLAHTIEPELVILGGLLSLTGPIVVAIGTLANVIGGFQALGGGGGGGGLAGILGGGAGGGGGLGAGIGKFMSGGSALGAAGPIGVILAGAVAAGMISWQSSQTKVASGDLWGSAKQGFLNSLSPAGMVGQTMVDFKKIDWGGFGNWIKGVTGTQSGTAYADTVKTPPPLDPKTMARLVPQVTMDTNKTLIDKVSTTNAILTANGQTMSQDRQNTQTMVASQKNIDANTKTSMIANGQTLSADRQTMMNTQTTSSNAQKTTQAVQDTGGLTYRQGLSQLSTAQKQALLTQQAKDLAQQQLDQAKLQTQNQQAQIVSQKNTENYLKSINNYDTNPMQNYNKMMNLNAGGGLGMGGGPLNSEGSPVGFTTPHVNAQFHQKMNYGVHQGVDFEATQGTPIGEFMGGKVTGAGFYPWGGEVDVQTYGGLTERYLHLSTIGVQRGQMLHPGQQLGLTGGGTVASGLGYWSSGAHSHVQIDKGDINNGLNPWPLWAAMGNLNIAQHYGVAGPGFTGTNHFLSDGGVVTRPTPIVAGEGGEPEAVLPLSKLAMMLEERDYRSHAHSSSSFSTPSMGGGSGSRGMQVSKIADKFEVHVHTTGSALDEAAIDNLGAQVLDILTNAIDQMGSK